MATAATKVEKFVDKEYQNAFMTGMGKLRQDEQYTDVTLQSGDVEIQCHRNVLAVASDSFKAMFGCGLENNTIPMTMDPEILTSIVDYLYTGGIELRADNVERLVDASDVLQLKTLKAACDSFMLKQVEPDNCIRLGKLSALYQLSELQRIANRMMKSEFKAVALTDEFKQLSCTELVELIKDDEVNVRDEDVVFEAVLRWVQYDLDARKAELDVIMEHVRLPFCSRHYLGQIGDNEDVLTVKCFKYIHEAMAFQAGTMKQRNCRTVPRNYFWRKSCLVVVGGATPGEQWVGCYKHCHYYDEDNDRWELMTELPQSVKMAYSVCHVEGGLLLTGGLHVNGDDSLDQCLRYDLATKKWETMPSLLISRLRHSSVSMGNCVYVVGGDSYSTEVGATIAYVECLDMTRRQWSTMPDLPHHVWDSTISAYKNKIFLFGGRDSENEDTCFTQVLDVARGSWSTVSDTPVKFCFGAAVTLNDLIYVVGGKNKTFLKYDPASDSWTRLSEPQHDHTYGSAVVWRGLILVSGGGDEETGDLSSVIEAYHPATDTWSVCSVASLKEKLFGHCMFSVDISVDLSGL